MSTLLSSFLILPFFLFDMCVRCVVLGAIINAGADGSQEFDSEALAQYDFECTPRDAGLIDNQASEYLRNTLDHFKSVSKRFFCLRHPDAS